MPGNLIKSQGSSSHELMDESLRDNFYWSSPWRSLRSVINQRDNYECQVCKSMGKVTLKIESSKLIVHHIKPLEYYPDLALEPDNLLTVCQSCHNQIHFNAAFSNAKSWDDEWFGD